MGWSAELIEDDTEVIELAGVTATADTFTWAPEHSPAVEMARLVRLERRPVAVTIDEVPGLPCCLDPASPLLPRHAPDAGGSGR